MINHIRTLLLNRSGDHGYGYDYPGEEFVLPTFREREVPAFLYSMLKALFGSNPDRLFLNYRMRQIMSLLHSTELEEFVHLPDSRVTYWPMVDDGFMDQLTTSVETISLGDNSWGKAYWRGTYAGGSASGTVESTWQEDGDYYKVAERNTPTPSLDMRVSFKGVPKTIAGPLEVRFAGYYTGSSNHNIQVQTTTNGTFFTSITGESKDLPDNGTENIHRTWPLSSVYVFNSVDGFGYVTIRIYLSGGGNTSHYVWLDRLTLHVTGTTDGKTTPYVVGRHDPDENAGILTQQWRVEVLYGGIIQVTRQTPPLTTSLESYTLSGGLTGEIPLAGTGLYFRVSNPVAGDTWLITSRAKPENDFGTVLQSAVRLIGQSGIDNLFRSTAEPIPTLKSVWESHHLFAYKYSAILLAIACYLNNMDPVA